MPLTAETGTRYSTSWARYVPYPEGAVWRGEPDGATEWCNARRLHHVSFDADAGSMTVDVSIAHPYGPPMVDP